MKRTPFHDFHVALGAKMVPFAGYEMPVTYPQGLLAEHNAVRTGVGVFDVSHMGEFIVTGNDALTFLNRVTCNDVSKLAVGQIQYSGILNERGTFEDDCLVYRFADHYMMVVNASNAPKDLAHITKQIGTLDAKVRDVTDDTALLAVQGPNAETIVTSICSQSAQPLANVLYYHFTTGTVAGVKDVIISRTGYTGEDGFELYFPVQHAGTIWTALMNAKVQPCGLGCRDTLRLEMGMALYGNDIDDTVTPLEAGLAWITKLSKSEFTGKPVLDKQKAEGFTKKLVGFTIAERGAIPRHGYPVYVNGEPSGTVCSGTQSPSLGISIGTCYVPAAHSKEGSELEVEIRGRRVAGTVVKFPFYKQATHK